MAERRPLVIVGGNTREIPVGDLIPSGTFDPHTWLGFAATSFSHPNLAVLAASSTHYVRVQLGRCLASKVGLLVGTQSGNIQVAVYRNSGSGRNAVPNNRVAVSSVVACPAAGYAEVPLDVAVDVVPGDWLALAVDNGTATFGGEPGGMSVLRNPFTVREAVYPCPTTATAGSLVSYHRTHSFQAVP